MKKWNINGVGVLTGCLICSAISAIACFSLGQGSCGPNTLTGTGMFGLIHYSCTDPNGGYFQGLGSDSSSGSDSTTSADFMCVWRCMGSDPTGTYTEPLGPVDQDISSTVPAGNACHGRPS
jgi:hypothetical protein